MNCRYPTREFRSLHRAAWAIALLLATFARADDDVDDLLRNARPAATPPPASAPDPAKAVAPKAPAEARVATIVLSTGLKIHGPVWTTAETPLRVWIDENKSYRDVDLDLVSQIEVHVLKEGMEDDWRWLKEGSDQKIYSGKKYPNVDLAYRFTLANGQAIEGTVVAPLFVLDGLRERTLALYKKYKGPLDSTMKDLVYIRSVTFDAPAAAAPQMVRTTHLPLLPE